MNSRAPDLFDAVYTTDGVGRTLTGRFRACSTPCTHILAIDRDGLVASFAYQDVHYFLTESRGQHAAAPAHRAGSGVGEGAVDLSYDDAGDQTSWSGTRPEGAGVETVLMSYGDDRQATRTTGGPRPREGV